MCDRAQSTFCFLSQYLCFSSVSVPCSYLCVWMMVEHVHLDLLGWGRRRPGHTTFLYHWFNFFFKSIFSFVCLWRCRQTHLFFLSLCSGEGKAADVSELAGKIMATAASLQPIALHTGAPGFYTRVKSTDWRNYCFQNKPHKTGWQL